jgi:glucose-6-phosphate 1-dehydrogenase
MKAQKKLPPTIIIIFGGSGDLTSRKLVPALFNLFIDDYLPDDFAVAGIGRTDYGGEEKYREHLLEAVKEFSRRKDHDEEWKKFSEKVCYVAVDVKDDAAFGEIMDNEGTKESTMLTTCGSCSTTGAGYCKKIIRSKTLCKSKKPANRF